MSAEKGPESPETEDKSRSTAESFTNRLDLFVKKAKEDGGCTFKTKGADDAVIVCGAPPHNVKQDPPNKAGKIVLHIDCHAGHEDQWQFEVDYQEMQREAASAQAALRKTQGTAEAAAVERDPMVASITIKLNLASQEVSIDPYVPTPLVGLGMLAIAQKSFFDQLAETDKVRKDGLDLPSPKKIVSPGGTVLN